MRTRVDRTALVAYGILSFGLISGCGTLPDLSSVGASGTMVAADAATPVGATGNSPITTGAIGGRVDVGPIRALVQNGQRGEALAQLRQTAGKTPIGKTDALDLGTLALELEDASLALDLLAAAEDPNERPGWRLLSARGMALALQGRYREARGLFEQAAKLSPDNPSVLNNLAMALAAEGEATRAEGILRRALGKRPGDGRIKDNLALVLALQGRDGEARALAENLFSKS